MKNLKKFAALILAITFVLSAFTVPASAVQTMEMELTPPDSELDHRPGYFTHLQVTQGNTTFVRTFSPYQTWSPLQAGANVQVTWENWSSPTFNNGVAFIRVLSGSTIGFIERARLSIPTWWTSIS